jgi:hypothetical protein
MDNPDADPNKPHLEQVTYLERLNSGYQNEVGTNFFMVTNVTLIVFRESNLLVGPQRVGPSKQHLYTRRHCCC